MAIITGGAGLLGLQHAGAIAEQGGIPLIWDINSQKSIYSIKSYIYYTSNIYNYFEL